VLPLLPNLNLFFFLHTLLCLEQVVVAAVVVVVLVEFDVLGVFPSSGSIAVPRLPSQLPHERRFGMLMGSVPIGNTDYPLTT
jgi:hypothetical protein